MPRATDSRRILLVEDNPDDRELMRIALEQNRLANEILIAEDGESALERIRGDESFALIILDLRLPKLSGHEVLREIRRMTRQVPVVVMTSSNEEHDLIESYDLGVNSYIRKPVDFENFLVAMKQLGMYWLLLNETPARRIR